MSRFNESRRRLLQGLGASSSLVLPGLAQAAKASKPPRGRVVIVGAGFAGATAAKYLRKWSDKGVDVTLIERQPAFISCPTSNEVLGGNREYQTLVHSYDGLRQRWGVKLVRASVTSVDTQQKRVRTDAGDSYAYDRLIVAPGIDFMFDQIEGYDAAAQKTVLHAWKAGPQTLALRQQLEAMPNGGTFVLSIPKAPYRCPPGPYERVCQVAWYFKQHKPGAKIVVLDANDGIVSKGKLFQGAWNTEYAGMVDYRPNWNVTGLDAATKTVTSEVGDTVTGDVLNVIPPMRAGEIARQTGLVNMNDRWAGVNWVTFESTAVPHVHVLGDAVFAAPQMPKSGHMANQHGKAVAAALIEIFSGREPKPMIMANTCYSMLDNKHGVHVASVHRYNPEKQAPLIVEGTGGVSSGPSVEEGRYAHGWAVQIWADTLS